MPDIPDRLGAALADRYRLERELGQGGMATVYLAEDLKHQRRVAIKVLKPDLAAVLGAERFVQEITTTAALQHPHILPLFDSGTADGFLYYVMPFIDGETLRTRLDRETQLGIDESVAITAAVADALDYAHRHGVIHRDIKPENILLHDGRPMVADFGIALAVSAAAGGRMTETGLSLGTPHYMSPEQATAEKEITARSDVYSLGSVCYEMLSGEPPHMGTSAQAIIMKIVTEDAAPVTRLRKNVPPHVAAAVAKAIEKLPADRFATAREFGDALTNPAFHTVGGAAGSVRPSVSPTVRRAVPALAAALLVATAAAAWGWLRPAGGAADGVPVVRAELDLGDSLQVAPIPSVRLDISPDGRRVVFVGTSGGTSSLWIRDLASGTVRQLPETRNAIAPFFSPDGESVGFFSGTQSGRSDLRVIGIRDGVVQTLVKDSVSTYGASWADDGNIYFSHSRLSLAKVPARGGAVTIVAQPDSAANIRELDFPSVLAGSRFAVVMLWRGSIGSNSIGLVDLEAGTVRDLLPGTYARYAHPGRLVVGTSEGALVVVEIDPERGELRGSPARVMTGAQMEGSNGTVQFAVSRSGTLVYQGGEGGQVGLGWVDRTGAVTPVDSTMPGLGFNGVFASLALSPGEGAVAITQSAGTQDEIWIKQLPAGAFTRLALDAGANRPAWSPDGREVAFLTTRNGVIRSAWVRRADGSDTARPLIPSLPPLDEVLFHPDGRQLILRTEGSVPGTRKLLAWTRGVDSLPRLLFDSPFDHYAVSVSPDGRWIAYVSEESGDPEVYVRPYPAVDSARFAVSIGGGIEPLWSPTGRELFYRDRRGAMFAVAVETTPSFRAGTPQQLFYLPELNLTPYFRGYDVSADGRRFLMLTSGKASGSSLQLVLNWRRELDERAAQGAGR